MQATSSRGSLARSPTIGCSVTCLALTDHNEMHSQFVSKICKKVGHTSIEWYILIFIFFKVLIPSIIFVNILPFLPLELEAKLWWVLVNKLYLEF